MIKENIKFYNILYLYQNHLDLNFLIIASFCRGLPLHRSYDRYRKWRCMEDESIFVYREGTLGRTNHIIVPNSVGTDRNSSDGYDYGSVAIRDKGNNDRVSCVVPLEDIVVSSL